MTERLAIGHHIYRLRQSYRALVEIYGRAGVRNLIEEIAREETAKEERAAS